MFKNLKSILQKKIKFVSDYPPIHSQKENLEKIESWMNDLISDKGFNSENIIEKETYFLDGRHFVTCGSTIINNQDIFKEQMEAFAKNKNLKINTKKNIRCISDASIERETSHKLYTKFHLNMQINVIWSHFYSIYGFGRVDHILNEKEVPPPLFSYKFLFREKEWDKIYFLKTGHAKTVFHLDERTKGIYTFEYDNPKNLNKNENEYLNSFGELLNKFNNFVLKVNDQISKYNIDIWNVDNEQHPVNWQYRRDRTKLNNKK